MRLHGSIGALILAWVAIGLTSAPRALGRPGVTPVPCPQQEWVADDPQFEPLPGAKAFSGKYDGGIYRVEIPEKWNGDLVLYAHGFVTNGGPQGSHLRVGNAVIRQHLVDRGYAWATSSYRCNGYVPGQGLVDTMALTDRFLAHNEGRQPRRIYLTGSSMGGHVTVLGMHEYPTTFVGGLAMCPAGPELFDFFAASSAAAEVVTGIRFTPDTMQQDIAAMTEQLGKPPDLTPKGRQLASIEIQISGGPRPFAVEGLASRLLPNISTSPGALIGSTTPLNRAVDTVHVRYSIDDGLGLTTEQINARARRKAGDPAVRTASGPYEEIVPYDGRIERPLLTMHGTGDLFVPIFLQQTLKQSVREAGRLDLLAQRIYRISGHCGFSQPEMIRAFDDLVTWVEQGRKPAGDEVDGDLTNAGLQFTDPLRPNDPGTRRIPSSSQP